MEKQPHLLVCISGHGLGHLAQVAPVLNALHDLQPGLTLTLRTAIPEQFLRQRIKPKFNHVQEATDFGMRMYSALEVDVEASMLAYTELHTDWPARVANEAERLRELAPDIVLTDVAYLPLAAAAQVAIPCVSLCSLNWADIFRHYCGGMKGADQILREIESAYAQAICFLQPTPAMPMHWLDHRNAIGPLAEPGQYRRNELDRVLGLAPDDRLILVSMGGIATHFSVEHWPNVAGMKWLVQKDWLEHTVRHDMFAFEAIDLPFSDLLASCDLLLTKPGYGAFVEAAASGIPVLFVRRDDWPEQSYLIEWLQTVGACYGIDAAQATRGDFNDEIRALLFRKRPLPIQPTGNRQAAEYVLRLLEHPPSLAA
jgi:hypothetical protein